MEPPKPLEVELDSPPVASYRDAETGGRLRIKYPCHAPGRTFLTIFALLWNGAVVAALLADAPGFLAAVFPLLHLAAGIVLLWFTLAAWLNRRVILIEKGKLSQSVGPLTFSKPQAVSLRSIETFRIKKRNWDSNWKPVHEFFVVARVKGRSIEVASELATEAAAQYLKKRLDRHAGIKDTVDVRVIEDTVESEFEEQDELAATAER